MASLNPYFVALFRYTPHDINDAFMMHFRIPHILDLDVGRKTIRKV